ncbi:MAG: ubiquinone/menaquinone biosynthesis C-methylase UbiE [Candidatus Azotimanducaceae bacterium]|jgi:ubiquinone/menaquinone biosynthesis C-methylase UbiE
MKLIGPENQDILNEIEVLDRMLTFDQARILELGCGAADKTKALAAHDGVNKITAVEIEKIQHEKNVDLKIPKVNFKSYGAQKIEEEDESFDIVMMFKSLHHVPRNEMDNVLKEIHRVLVPGGCVYFSEPVFAGEFNEIMRLFHDEEVVRREAFLAIQRAVDGELLVLDEEYFFKNVVKFKSFDQYASALLNVTHTDHQLSESMLAEVKRRFLSYESEAGFIFKFPNRVDVLRKPFAT